MTASKPLHSLYRESNCILSFSKHAAYVAVVAGYLVLQLTLAQYKNTPELGEASGCLVAIIIELVLGSRAEPGNEQSYKTPTGLDVEELQTGSGSVANLGDTVQIDYVCRRQNGYFIYSTVEGVSFQPLDVPTGPVTLTLGDPSVISGVTEALIGKKAGTKLRLSIPPDLGYLQPDMKPSPPNFAARRQLINHGKEPLSFEIKLLRVHGVRG